MFSDTVSTGSFANLKLTAEKLVKEQASAKTDLQLAVNWLNFSNRTQIHSFVFECVAVDSVIRWCRLIQKTKASSSKLKKLLTEDVRMLEEKLQNAYNENAKLKVKQKEDEKLWKGLESKFSSTKTLCDQLTETLQHLAGVVQDAEKDEASLEDKQSATSVVIDNLQDNMNALYLSKGKIRLCTMRHMSLMRRDVDMM